MGKYLVPGPDLDIGIIDQTKNNKKETKEEDRP